MINATINPHDVYCRDALTKLLGLSKTTLAREARLGRLAPHPIGGRHYYIGAEVLRWLAAATVVTAEQEVAE